MIIDVNCFDLKDIAMQISHPFLGVTTKTRWNFYMDYLVARRVFNFNVDDNFYDTYPTSKISV